MTTLTQQLKHLREQQKELEKRIQEEKEHKKKLNNEASIERLEALVEPITESLNFIRRNTSKSNRDDIIQKYDHKMLCYNNNITKHPNKEHFLPRKEIDLEKEEIFVTLIGILKKQDERIKKLEKKEIENLKVLFQSKYLEKKMG